MEIKETSIKNYIDSMYKLFDLSDEELEIFITAVNKLPSHVYRRGDECSLKFLTAINSNNAKVAESNFVKLPWRGAALKILHCVHAIHKIENESFREDYIERIYSDAAKYKEADAQNIKCPRCGTIMGKYSEVCHCCGALIYEI